MRRRGWVFVSAYPEALFREAHSDALKTCCPEVFLLTGPGAGVLGHTGRGSARGEEPAPSNVAVLSRTRSSSEDVAGDLPAVRDLKKLEFA